MSIGMIVGMDRRRSNNRFALVFILALGAALTLGSFWVLEVMRKTMDESSPEVARTDPDYFVENFNYVRMSKTGQASYTISGKKMIHRPADDTHLIELPVINSLSNERPPMSSRAKNAVVDQTSSKVHMYGDVHIDRAATAQASDFHLRSDYLLMFPDDEVMQTDKPVEITFGTWKLTGVGMYANNVTRQLKLTDKVHATYQPPPLARNQ